MQERGGGHTLENSAPPSNCSNLPFPSPPPPLQFYKLKLLGSVRVSLCSGIESSSCTARARSESQSLLSLCSRCYLCYLCYVWKLGRAGAELMVSCLCCFLVWPPLPFSLLGPRFSWILGLHRKTRTTLVLPGFSLPLSLRSQLVYLWYSDNTAIADLLQFGSGTGCVGGEELSVLGR